MSDKDENRKILDDIESLKSNIHDLQIRHCQAILDCDYLTITNTDFMIQELNTETLKAQCKLFKNLNKKTTAKSEAV